MRSKRICWTTTPSQQRTCQPTAFSPGYFDTCSSNGEQHQSSRSPPLPSNTLRTERRAAGRACGFEGWEVVRLVVGRDGADANAAAAHFGAAQGFDDAAGDF